MNEVQVSPIVKVARDLREIETLFEALLVQAIHKAGARIDGTSLPGGDAMVALAGVGSPNEWSELVAAAEFHHLATCPQLDHTRCRYAEHVTDEDGSEPPLQTLIFWSEAWRGYPLGRRPTIATEANFLRGSLEWAWDNEPQWDAFAADIAATKSRLENLLLAGVRAERGVPCMYEDCRGNRLIRKLVPKRGPDGDKVWDYTDWHCTRCARSWNENDYARMVTAAHERTKFEDIDGVMWCTYEYAARHVDRSAKTIETWALRHLVPTVCLIVGKRTRFVNLEAVRERDKTARSRKRAG